MEYSWTGDPNADQQIMANLMAQSGSNFYRLRNALQEALAARGLLGGGMEAQGISELLQQRGANENQFSVGAAHAAAERYNRQREMEQATQNQMRLMEYQARLNRQKKMSAIQRILMGAGSGAAVGTAISPGWGTAIGAVGGGLYGYFGDQGDQ